MADAPATRATALALADEQTLMRQGHTFLDEKRVLLAAETMRRLAAYRAQEAALIEALQHAADTLRAALQRHGRAGLAAQPVPAAPALPEARSSRFLGVTLWHEVPAEPGTDTDTDDPGPDPSPEARACADAFTALLAPLAALGTAAGNLARLGTEYRRTERRALALENVLLPEVSGALAAIEEHLGLADQEEAVRIRLAARGTAGSGARSITQMG